MLRVVDLRGLPETFRAHAERRGDRLIYLGEAKQSLRQRLLNQELRARGHGTFFRSIGAVLGYRPVPGSLIGMKNQRNYTFSVSDNAAIVRWINTNLEVAWIELDKDIHATEVNLIRKHEPLFNLSGNPRQLEELAAIRAECQHIACRG